MSDRYTVNTARRALASLAAYMKMSDDLYLDVVSHADTGSKVRAVQKSTHTPILGTEYLSPREATRAYNVAETALLVVTSAALQQSRPLPFHWTIEYSTRV